MDALNTLPVDTQEPSSNEIEILETLFKENKTDFQMFMEGSKDILILGVLFMIFCAPDQAGGFYVDNLICKYVSIAKSSPYILLLIKAVLFMGIYFFIKNLYLVKV